MENVICAEQLAADEWILNKYDLYTGKQRVHML